MLLLHLETATVLFPRMLLLTTAPLRPTCPLAKIEKEGKKKKEKKS